MHKLPKDDSDMHLYKASYMHCKATLYLSQWHFQGSGSFSLLCEEYIFFDLYAFLVLTRLHVIK